MSYRLYRRGRIRILASKPTADGFGSAVAEILNSLYIGRELQARVFFVKPGQPLNQAIFHLESDAVPIVPQNGVRAVVMRAVWALSHLRPEMRERMRLRLLKRARAQSRDRRLSKERRGAAKRRVSELKAKPPRHAGAATRELEAAISRLDFRRLYATDPLVARLPKCLSERADAQAAAAGISLNAPIVTLHVRESAYKRSLDLPERPTDEMRNGDIGTYTEAVDSLVERGFTVVRIGDSTATPFHREGVVDLAISPLRTEILELRCLAASRFFIASDSGPYMAAILLGVPTLAVNVTALIGGDPLRPADRFILKRALDLRVQKTLSLTEMLTPEYLIAFRNLELYRHLNNTSDEIRAAVDEMVDDLTQPKAESPAQREYRNLAENLARAPEIVGWRRAAGITQALYVGRGRISDDFARRHLVASELKAARP